MMRNCLVTPLPHSRGCAPRASLFGLAPKPSRPVIKELLHRFPAAPRPGIDVLTFIAADGSTWVKGIPARQKDPPGLSFLKLNDKFSGGIHNAFRGQGMLAMPGTELQPGFEMMRINSFQWSLSLQRRDQRVAVPRTGASLITVGEHYHLIPRKDMPLSSFTSEVSRLTSTPCPFSTTASTSQSEFSSCWPYDYPMDCLLLIVVDALHAAWRDGPNSQLSAMDCSLALLYCVSICSQNSELDDMLRDPVFVRLSLAATEQYVPMEEDGNILIIVISDLADLRIKLAAAQRAAGADARKVSCLVCLSARWVLYSLMQNRECHVKHWLCRHLMITVPSASQGSKLSDILQMLSWAFNQAKANSGLS